MNKRNGSSSGYIILVIAVILILAICAMIFGKNDMNNDNNTTTNIYEPNAQGTNVVEDTINIVDENAKELYDRVAKGITLDGKLIEVPADYMKKITNKITATGYKMTDETKTAINNKLDEVENIVRGEGKNDIKDFSEDSQNKLKSIAKDIEDML